MAHLHDLPSARTHEFLEHHGDEPYPYPFEASGPGPFKRDSGSPPWSSKCSYTNAPAYSFGESAEHKFSLNNPPKATKRLSVNNIFGKCVF